MRAINRASVLNLLRQRHTLSRQDLVEITGLSPAAVSGVVGELISEGWVQETQSGPPRGGRPPVLLEIAYDHWHAAGAKVMEDHLEIVLTDLRTEVLAQQQVPFTQQTPEALVVGVKNAVTALQRKFQFDPSKLVGLGVGMAGVIDPQEGICIYSPYLHWKNVPVKKLLEGAFHRPVWVDNDVNALATAEMLFGHGKNARNMVVITVGRGIGAGLVLEGQLYRGASGGAGELGHTISVAQGQLCECGKRGCLEAYASEPAILGFARQNFPDLVAKHKPLQVKHIVTAAQKGHLGAQELLCSAGERLGLALANLVNLVNPEVIVIGGEGVRLGRAFFEPVETTLRSYIFNGLGDHLQLFIDPWGDDAWARGAAGLAIQRQLFADPLGVKENA